MNAVEPCIHELDPETCTICNGSETRVRQRSASDVSKHRYFTCGLCERSLPETKFPTSDPGVRATGRCRECRDYLVDQRKQSVPDGAAVAKRRRQFGLR